MSMLGKKVNWRLHQTLSSIYNIWKDEAVESLLEIYLYVSGRKIHGKKLIKHNGLTYWCSYEIKVWK